MNIITIMIIVGFIAASSWWMWRCAAKADFNKTAKVVSAILGAAVFVFGQQFVDQILTAGSRVRKISFLEDAPGIYTTVTIFCITYAIIIFGGWLLVRLARKKSSNI